MWDLIVSVPDHCLSFCFIKRMQNNVQLYHSMQGTNKCKKSTIK